MHSYTFRANVFKPERSYTLEEDRLAWRDARGEGGVAYRDIERLRVYAIPRTVMPGQFLCLLFPRGGGKIALSATHYKGVGRPEDRSASYAPFVRALIARVAEANPRARFTAGQSWGMWAFWLVILIAIALILVALVLAVLGGAGVPALAFVALIVVIAALPAAWKVIRHGRPRPFDPAAVPESVLPG